ncbi:MAG: phage tail protein [Bacteroidota bacterium]
MAYDLLSLLPPGQPPLSHKFGVFFFVGGAVPSIADLRFQKISGLGYTLEMETVVEGGNPLYEHRLPKQVRYDNVTLERGFTGTLGISTTFDLMRARFKFYTSTCIITLFGESGLPRAGWKLNKVFPVKWTLSDLDGNSSQVLVNSLELAYADFDQLAI